MNITITQKYKHCYIIETPLGNFDDINKAIEVFPNLTKDKHVIECEWCGKYFLRYGTKYNGKKTCDSTCAKLLKQHNDRCRKSEYIAIKKQVSEINLHDFIQSKGALPDGFNQDDSFYELGESNLTQNVTKDSKTGEYDWDKELKVIQKEKRRLLNRKAPYTLNLDGD